MVTTLVGEYREFGHIAMAVLQMAAVAHGIKLSNSEIHKVQTTLQRMPAFADVKAALKRLRATGFRLAVLTNSAPATLNRQLENAGLSGFFEETLSVHSVGRFKPAPEPYQFAARSLNVQASEILMVAAHHWDLWGASRAGFQTAFLKRPGKALFPEGPLPNYVAADLKQLATQLSSSKGNVSFAKPTAIAACVAAALLTGVIARRIR